MKEKDGMGREESEDFEVSSSMRRDKQSKKNLFLKRKIGEDGLFKTFLLKQSPSRRKLTHVHPDRREWIRTNQIGMLLLQLQQLMERMDEQAMNFKRIWHENEEITSS